MKLTDIPATREHPVYVNLAAPANTFASNLKWDGVLLSRAAHNLTFTRQEWIAGTDATVAEIMGDDWEVKSEGSIPLRPGTETYKPRSFTSGPGRSLPRDKQ
jgi:hypothetical protein